MQAARGYFRASFELLKGLLHLPGDCEILAVHQDEKFSEICVLIASDHLPVVVDGSRVPEISPAFLVREVKVVDQDTGIALDRLTQPEVIAWSLKG